MNNLADKGPDLIREAAKSPLGLLAFVLLLVSIVALVFFATASEWVRVVSFVLILIAASLFAAAVFRLANQKPSTPLAEAAPPESAADKTKAEAANQKPAVATPPPPEPRPVEREEPRPRAQEPVKADARVRFDWVTIPAGYFVMGGGPSGQPGQRLFLPEYRIARSPVTVAQFRHFVTAMQKKTTAEQLGYAHDLDPGNEDDKWPNKPGAYWECPHGAGIPANDDCPVTCISWQDAIAYCKWAGVRLPTEAEWEKAARNEQGSMYPWGNESPDAQRCNFNMTVGDVTPVPTLNHPIDPRYPPGAHGLYDMAGNVWEWTASLYRTAGYELNAGLEDPAQDGDRVLRGGSFFHNETRVRSTFRHYHRPTAVVSDIGFRVCAL